MPQYHAIILAAGAASRYGANKLLAPHPHGQGSLLTHTLGQVSHALVTHVSVITGCYHDEISEVIDGDIDLVYCQDWHQGLGASVNAGLAWARQFDAHVIFVLGDQVALTSEDINQLIRKSQLQPNKIIGSRYGDIVGVPVCIPRTSIELFQLTDLNKGAGPLLRQWWLNGSAHCEWVSLPRGAIDIDTPEDWVSIK
jgi:molybdenum cofactor cytidylyltransferase